MPVVGLTGGIASAKSTVARLFAARGAAVLDADDAARRVTEPDGPAFHAVVRRFGPEILSPDGRIDKAGLAELAFRDVRAKSALEEETHPHIFRLLSRQVKALPRGTFVVIEAALLMETRPQWTGELEPDAVVMVFSPPERQLERLTEGRKMSESAALARIRAQEPWEPRLSDADYVIENTGTLEELENAAAGVWDDLLTRLGGA